MTGIRRSGCKSIRNSPSAVRLEQATDQSVWRSPRTRRGVGRGVAGVCEPLHAEPLDTLVNFISAATAWACWKVGRSTAKVMEFCGSGERCSPGLPIAAGLASTETDHRRHMGCFRITRVSRSAGGALFFLFRYG